MTRQERQVRQQRQGGGHSAPPASSAPSATDDVSLASIQEAAAGLAGVASRTELLEVPELSRPGAPVYLKLESQQPTGAFKTRGAWTAVRRLDPAGRAKGVITHSSGNHGQAVAFAAHPLCVRALIVMPPTRPQLQAQVVRRCGVWVEL